MKSMHRFLFYFAMAALLGALSWPEQADARRGVRVPSGACRGISKGCSRTGRSCQGKPPRYVGDWDIPHLRTKVEVAKAGGRMARYAPDAADKAHKVPLLYRGFLSMPADEGGFARVFGEQPTGSMMDDIQRLEEGLDGMDFFVRESDEWGEGLEAFMKLLEDPEHRITFVVGHNEAGEFVFVDGSRVSLAQLSDECVAHQKFCVFVSCNADVYVKSEQSAAVGSVITYDHAVAIVEEVMVRGLEKAMSSGALDLSPDELAKILTNDMQKVVDEGEGAVRIEFVVYRVQQAAGAAVAGGALLVVAEYYLD